MTRFLLTTFCLLLLLAPVHAQDRRRAFTAVTVAEAAWSATNTFTTQLLVPTTIANIHDDRTNCWGAINGKDATNTTAGTARPTIKTDGPNSQRYLRFNNDTATWLQTANWTSSIAQPYTIYIAFREWDITGNFLGLLDGNDAVNRCLLMDVTDNLQVKAFDGFETTFVVDTAWHILFVEVNGASTRYSVDCAAWVTLAASPGSAGLAGITLGQQYDLSSGGYFDIGEVGITNGVLNLSHGATNYANARWR